MFTQVDNITIPLETKLELIKKNFLVIGDINFDKEKLLFNIMPHKDSLSFLFDVEIISNVKNHEKNFEINVIIKSTPTILSWLIGICFFPFGFVTFFFAHNKSQKVSDSIKLMKW
jgi:hypothetical protein